MVKKLFFLMMFFFAWSCVTVPDTQMCNGIEYDPKRDICGGYIPGEYVPGDYIPGDLSDVVIIGNLMIQNEDFFIGDVSWSSASTACASSQKNGYSGWRLPTLLELYVIYENKNSIPGLFPSAYWSSTDDGDWYDPWYYYLDLGIEDSDIDAPYSTHRVRCVR